MLVLVTGAAGQVATLTIPQLAKRYQLRLTDRRRIDPPWDAPFYQADITDSSAMAPILAGVDVVIHLAAQGFQSSWPEVWPTNILGFHNILQAAVKWRCRRVIFASTIQVVDAYPADVVVPAGAAPRPINPYALSKAIGETMAHAAAIQAGVSVLCIRLGSVTARERVFGMEPRRLERVITADDLGRLWAAAIEADQALDFGIFHGLSANRRCRLDLTDTIQTLDYRPVDDAFMLAEHNHRQSYYKTRAIVRSVARRWRN